MREEAKIVMIGAGNVAHHLATTWVKNGVEVCQIYSRTLESARELGQMTGVAYTDDLAQVYPDADIYVFCVSDDALPGVLKSLRLKGDPLLIHTAGSLPASLLKPYSWYYGVLYPLQTFSRARRLDFSEIPLFIEGSTGEVEEEIERLAGHLQGKIYSSTFEERKRLHLAAVFACNFTNYLYGVAEQLLGEKAISFSVLRPLIEETAQKVMTLSPREAQTGPARRGDETVINRHRTLLKHQPELLALYNILSGMIDSSFRETEEEAPESKEASEGMGSLFEMSE